MCIACSVPLPSSTLPAFILAVNITVCVTPACIDCQPSLGQQIEQLVNSRWENKMILNSILQQSFTKSENCLVSVIINKKLHW